MDTPLDQALAALPHGPEFRFVDKLTALDPEKSAIGLYTVKGSEDFLKAHFPGNPMMPGVIMIEAIAQVAGIAAQHDTTESPSFTDLRLAAVGQVKILDTARPGDQLIIHANIVASMGGLIMAEGHITIADDENDKPSIIVKAKITLSVAG